MTMEIHTENNKVTEVRLDGLPLEIGEVLSVEQDGQHVTIISRKTYVVNEVQEVAT